MSKLIEKINALLFKAGHPNTPINEASSCALAAAKLIYKNQNDEKERIKIKLVEENNSSTNEYTDPTLYQDEPIDITNQDIQWTEVKPFNTVHSKSNDICKKCNKSINKGEIIARVTGVGSTHHRCRHYWTQT